MTVTSAEIREKRFRTSMMGYSPKEVDAFISTVADEFEELTKEGHILKGEVKRLGDSLELYREREESIKKTVMATQKLCEDMKKNTDKECRIILSEAEFKADNLLAKAEQRLALIAEDISEMKRQKVRFGESLRSLLLTHFKLLEVSKEDEQGKRGIEQGK